MKKLSTAMFLLLFLAVQLVVCFSPTQVTESYSRASDGVTSFSSGDFRKSPLKRRATHIYISIQGAVSSKRFLTAVQNSFLSKGFTLAHSPSEADVIVQITIAYLGRAEQEDLKRAVRKGYDSKLVVTGNKSLGLLADLLLVARDVPEAKNDKQLKLQNISQRLALSSSTVRVGFTQKGSGATLLSQALVESFAKTVTKKVLDAIG